MGVPGKRSIIDVDTVMSPFAGLSIWLDVCGRTSKCQKCYLPIKSKEKRLCISSKAAQMGQGGGYIKTRKAFFHPDCFVAYLGGENPVHPEDSCMGCHAVLEDGKRHRGRITTLHLGMICEECKESPNWTLCGNCYFNVPKYKASAVLKQDEYTDLLRSNAKELCDECSSIYEIPTVKSDKARRRDERKAESERLDLVVMLTKKYMK